VLDQPGRQLVHAGAAAGAAVLPVRAEHEVADDELAAPVEQVEQGGLAFGALEDVLLLDLDHGELAALGDERVAAAGELLLLGEELLAVAEPFVPGYDVWKAHTGCDPASRRDSSANDGNEGVSVTLFWPYMGHRT
jgi:hypothetical protein